MQAEKEAAADVDEVMRLRECRRGDGQHVPARRHHRGEVEPCKTLAVFAGVASVVVFMGYNRRRPPVFYVSSMMAVGGDVLPVTSSTSA